MIKELIKLEHNILNLGATALYYLSPPIIDITVLRKFLKENYNVTFVIEELEKLYLWHNGTDHSKISDNYCISYLSEQFAINSLDIVADSLSVDPVYKFVDNGLFPFAQSYNGEYYSLKFSDKKIYYCSTSDIEVENVISMFDNMESLLITINKWYQADCMILNEDGNIELDLDRYDTYMQIGEELNKNSDYWRVKKEW